MKINRYKIVFSKKFNDFEFYEKESYQILYRNRINFLIKTFLTRKVFILADNKFEVRKKAFFCVIFSTLVRLAVLCAIIFMIATWKDNNIFAALGQYFGGSYVKNSPLENSENNKSVSFNDINSYIRKDIPRTSTGEIDYKQSPRVIYTVNTQEVIADNNRCFYPTNPEMNAYGITYSVMYNDTCIWADDKITLPGCYAEIDIYDSLPIGTSEISLVQQIVELNNLTSLNSVSSSVSYSTKVQVIKK